MPDRFGAKDINNDVGVVVEGILEHKDKLYNLYDLPKTGHGPTTLIAKNHNRSKIRHERLARLNFQSKKVMIKFNMAQGLPKASSL